MQPYSFSHEEEKIKNGHSCVAGVDEVGRGPWAGPVVAAAVVLTNPEAEIFHLVRDSKKLSPARREKIAQELPHHAHIGLGEASVEEIDRLNILRASLLAMERAVLSLPACPDFAFIDGNRTPAGLAMPSEAVIKGDGTVLSIACAAIVAKVHRDGMMRALSEKFPHYGWESNMGYGTSTHRSGLQAHGVTPHHRRSFAPVRACLESAPCSFS